LAKTYLNDVWYYKSKSATETLDTAEQLALKSIELSGENSTAHVILSTIYVLRRQYDKAITECQKAIDLSPNSAEANYRFAHALRWAGRFDEAITYFEKAIRLNPVYPMQYINSLAWAYAYSEKHEKAISLWNSVIERNPDHFFSWLGLTMSYQLSGNEVKAREAAAEVMRLKPNLTISKIKKGPATRGWDRERGQEALRKAGIPP
jgi:adenylate cyclase